MHELVSIAAVPGVCTKEYKKSLEDHFKFVADNAVPEHKIEIKKEELKKQTIESWQHATAVMASAMKVKKRLEARGE